jgi:hypothetical protein
MYLKDQKVYCDERIWFQTKTGPRIIEPMTELTVGRIGVIPEGDITIEFKEIQGVIFPLRSSFKPIDDLTEDEILNQ